MKKKNTGRPFRWPWLETEIGRSFVLTAMTIGSVRSSVSRANRLWGVRYIIRPHPEQGKWRLRRKS